MPLDRQATAGGVLRDGNPLQKTEGGGMRSPSRAFREGLVILFDIPPVKSLATASLKRTMTAFVREVEVLGGQGSPQMENGQCTD